MRTAITRAAVSVVVVVSATGIVFVTGMRAKSPVVVNGVRRLGRAMRPLAIKSAGGPGASARSSTTSDGRPDVPARHRWGRCRSMMRFVNALPYGLRRTGSRTWSRVDRPPSCTTAAPPVSSRRSLHCRLSSTALPADQRAHRLFGVDQCLRVRRPVAEQPDTVRNRLARAARRHGGGGLPTVAPRRPPPAPPAPASLTGPDTSGLAPRAEIASAMSSERRRLRQTGRSGHRGRTSQGGRDDTGGGTDVVCSTAATPGRDRATRRAWTVGCRDRRRPGAIGPAVHVLASYVLLSAR